MSSLQEIAGIRQMLDRLEQRTIGFREVLLNMSLGNSAGEGAEKKAIKNAEVEPVENAIVDLANRLTGGDPQPGMWERSHPYCSRNEAKGKSSWGAQNYEYFQWFLYWIEMSRTYLEFLAGYQSASGEPRSSSAVASAPTPGSPRISSDRRPYDVALSFAGEDRKYARDLAAMLRADEFTVFYDEYEQWKLWGRNLYVHLSETYQNRAEFCVMFLSEHYAKKLWTNHEREAAQARAFEEGQEYILPVRLDDTKIPGVLPTTGYVDLRVIGIQDVFEMLKKKLRDRRAAAQ